ncbi:MAG: GNAT family N-acetyltransferase [Candidatus Eisenbacteria bacterium]|nr:GNAT family N-acetyltransferase [Candidatus Eisenbacteria bacterium]
MIAIREFDGSEADYEAAVRLWNESWPEYVDAVEEWQHHDRVRNTDYLHRRFVGEVDGAMVGYAECGEHAFSHVPGKYFVFVNVHPEHRGRGYGTALFEHAASQLDGRDPKVTVICSDTREDKDESIRFLSKRGFERVMRFPISNLYVDTFDFAKFEGVDERVAAEGIEIRSLAEIQHTDPDWKHHWYELKWEIFQDVPLPDPPTKQPFEVWVKQLEGPGFRIEPHWAALHEGKYVGMSELWVSKGDPSKLWQGLTGTVRGYRRKGIATALKLRGVEYARAQGVKVIQTDNEENNPMFHLNLKLGFVAQPAWLEFRKKLNGDGAGA